MQSSPNTTCRLTKWKHHHKQVNNLFSPAIMEDVEPKVQKTYESLTKKHEDWSSSFNQGSKSFVMEKWYKIKKNKTTVKALVRKIWLWRYQE